MGEMPTSTTQPMPGGTYALRRSRRGGRSRRDKKQQGRAAAPKAQAPPPQPEKTILKRLAPTDLARLAVTPPVATWDYDAQLLQRQRELYHHLLNAAAPDPYLPLLEDPLLWSPRPARCRECEAAAAVMREPGFHWCVRDAVTVGFRSHVGPIERPSARKSMSPPPPPASPHGRVPAFLGMSVY